MEMGTAFLLEYLGAVDYVVPVDLDEALLTCFASSGAQATECHLGGNMGQVPSYI